MVFVSYTTGKNSHIIANMQGSIGSVWFDLVPEF